MKPRSVAETPEGQILVEATAPAPDVARITVLARGITDWGAVFGLAQRHRVLPLVAYAVERAAAASALPESVAARLAAALAGARTNDRLHVLVLDQVRSTFQAKGIEFILLKGLGLGERFYPDPALRAPRDIDVLVRPADRPGAAEALAVLEFAPHGPESFETRHFHRPYVHRRRTVGAVVEVHWEVTLPFHTVQFATADWWGRAARVPLRVGEVLVPPPEDEPLYIAWHALRGGGVSLRELGDFARTWEATKDATVRDRITARAAATGAKALVGHALRLVRRLWRVESGAPGLVSADREESLLWRRLGRVLLAPEVVLERDGALWWPLGQLAHFCAVGPRRAGLGYLLRRASLLDLHEPAPEGGTPPEFSRAYAALVLAAAGLVCLTPARALALRRET